MWMMLNMYLNWVLYYCMGIQRYLFIDRPLYEKEGITSRFCLCIFLSFLFYIYTYRIISFWLHLLLEAYMKYFPLIYESLKKNKFHFWCIPANHTRYIVYIPNLKLVSSLYAYNCKKCDLFINEPGAFFLIF